MRNVCPCTYHKFETIIYLASLFVMSVPVHTPNIQHTYYIHANAISTCNVCPCTYPKYITYIYMLRLFLTVMSVHVQTLYCGQ